MKTNGASKRRRFRPRRRISHWAMKELGIVQRNAEVTTTMKNMGRSPLRSAGRSSSRHVRARRSSDRTHAVVLRVVLDLGEAEGLEDRGDVHAEAAAEAFLEAVPAADRVLGGAAPRFDGALGRGLLLVGAAEGHPVAVLLQHRVEVLDAAEVVAELGLADLADQRGRVEGLVAEDHEVRAAARGLQLPGFLARAGACAF